MTDDEYAMYTRRSTVAIISDILAVAILATLVGLAAGAIVARFVA